MKKLIVILSLVFALILAGFLYVAKVQSDEGKAVAAQVARHYPTAMHEVIVDPITGFVMY